MRNEWSLFKVFETRPEIREIKIALKYKLENKHNEINLIDKYSDTFKFQKNFLQEVNRSSY